MRRERSAARRGGPTRRASRGRSRVDGTASCRPRTARRGRSRTPPPWPRRRPPTAPAASHRARACRPPPRGGPTRDAGCSAAARRRLRPRGRPARRRRRGELVTARRRRHHRRRRSGSRPRPAGRAGSRRSRAARLCRQPATSRRSHPSRGVAPGRTRQLPSSSITTGAPPRVLDRWAPSSTPMTRRTDAGVIARGSPRCR